MSNTKNIEITGGINSENNAAEAANKKDDSKVIRNINASKLNDYVKKHLNSIPRNERSKEISLILETRSVSRKYNLSKAKVKDQNHYAYDKNSFSDTLNEYLDNEKEKTGKARVSIISDILNQVCTDTYNAGKGKAAKQAEEEPIPQELPHEEPIQSKPPIAENKVKQTVKKADKTEKKETVTDESFKEKVYKLLNIDFKTTQEEALALLADSFKKNFERIISESTEIINIRKKIIAEAQKEIDTYENLIEKSKESLKKISEFFA